MTVLSGVKSALIRPLMVDLPMEIIGSADQWGVVRGSLTRASSVICAGMGKSISFEEHLVGEIGATVIALDPSPTGLATVADRQCRSDDRFVFYPYGLAGKLGVQSFGKPDLDEEGSFRKGAAGDHIEFHCTTVEKLMTERGTKKLDLLKMDIEGFEYEVLDSVIRNRIDIGQICVEIHTNRSITIDQSIVDAYLLILRVCKFGYRIAYNSAMDFTFVSNELIRQHRQDVRNATHAL